jgi:hypothetical protein
MDLQGKMKERCPCCGYRTLSELGGFDLCAVCYWEDDGQTDADADEVRGGPNGVLSLTQGRANYHDFGACDRRFLENVRPPMPDEFR